MLQKVYQNYRSKKLTFMLNRNSTMKIIYSASFDININMIMHFLIVLPKSAIFLKKILKTARVAIVIHHHYSKWSSRIGYFRKSLEYLA